ncbi:hypothetical protein NEIG_02271 [Nematocida sp. ERTm5]|nr:hypothetical protein NEIG_02271 [Nematocida sp. ERTm5]
MKHLRKKCIIIGLICICIEIVICAGFKAKYKQDRKKDKHWPYNIEDSSINNNSSTTTSRSISNPPFLKTIFNNSNYALPSMNIHSMQIDEQTLSTFNPIKCPHDICK